MLNVALLLLALTGTVALPDGRDHVGVAGAFERGPSGDGVVVVRFMPLDDDIRVNAEPAPRLSFDPYERVLRDADRPAPPPTRLAFSGNRYLDTSVGVSFPADVAARTPAGRHVVRAKVVYFYCSQRHGWCRRAQDDVEVAVQVP